MKTRKTLILALHLAGMLGCNLGRGPKVATPSRLVPRLIIFLRDQTASFKPYLPAANDTIRRASPNLGPADRAVLCEVGGEFRPRLHVFEIPFPDVLQEWLFAASAPQYVVGRSRLETAWSRAEGARVEFGQGISRPVFINTAQTDIFTPLEWVSEQMGQFDGEKYLVLLSDLITDVHGLKTGSPPVSQMQFPGAKVVAMFVPWSAGGENERKMRKWRDWFEAGGATFAMYDEVASKRVVVIPPNAVPRKPATPLASGK